MSASAADATAEISHDDAQTMRFSVVLPAYNEAENLKKLIPEVVDVCREVGQTFEVLIVDDGSTDGTAASAHHFASLYEEVQSIELQANYGQSAALAAGLDSADGEIIVPMDADGQNDPEDIPRLLAELESGADCVSGWRRDRNDPLSKRVPSRIQTKLAKLTGPDIHDFGCTLTAYRKEAIEEVDLRGERHRYIPAVIHDKGFDVVEIEVNHRKREHGQSHYGISRLIRGFVDLVYHLFRNRYGARPMHLFGGLGLVLFIGGIGLGGWLSVQRLFLGVGLLPRLPALLLSISLTFGGFALFALGLVTEFLTEIRYEGERPYRIERVNR